MYPKPVTNDMLGKVMVLSGLAVSIGGVLQSDGLAGLGFLSHPVPTPVWFILMLAIIPTGETLRVVRRMIRQLGPKKTSKSES